DCTHKYCFIHRIAFVDCLSCSLQAAISRKNHSICSSRSCMRQSESCFFKVFPLLFLAQMLALMGCQSHAHSSSCIRSCTLRHHICDRLGNLLVGSAGYKLNLCGIDSPVQYLDGTTLIPCYILIP